MRVSPWFILLATLTTANCQPTDKAAAERWARFSNVPGSAPPTVLTLSVPEQLAIYEPLLPRPAFSAVDSTGRVIEDRATLDARFLADAGGSTRRMPDALREALLATERFAATCDHDVMHPCAEVGGTRMAFSPIYGIASGIVRVSVLWSGGGFAEEVMFRLEHRAGKWVVTDKMTVMIT